MSSTHNHDTGMSLPQAGVCAGDKVPTSPDMEKSVNETAIWQQNRSEVAAFIEQWEQETEAMQRGLHGTAITARHDFILKRMSGLIDEEKVDAMWQTLKAEQNASSVPGTTK